MYSLTRRTRRFLSLVALVGAAGCGQLGRTPLPGPPPLGLDAAGVLRAYVQSRPVGFKLRHQVGVTIADRSEAMQGILVVERPSRFWVRAMTPVGVSLFEVRGKQGRVPTVKYHAAAPADRRAAEYLARDIQRIYLDECAVDDPVRRHGRVYEVRCWTSHGDGGDDELRMDLTPGGVVWRKRFLRDGVVTAYVDYTDYRLHDEIWWAHRIVLSRSELSYRLTVALIEANASFDATAMLDRVEDNP